MLTFIKKNPVVARFLLKKFVKLHNYSYKQISFFGTVLNSGIHPKHRILNYHKFFTDRVTNNQRVLDLGCGTGFLSFDVAGVAKKVVGVDIKEGNIITAKKTYQRENLEFIVGDATKMSIEDKFDVIILSNVLEHIEDRISFLRSLKRLSDKILIRVPMITRDWVSAYKKEIGLEYKLDNTHFIEYTEEELKKEVTEVGWEITESQINWGEFWGVLQIK